MTTTDQLFQIVMNDEEMERMTRPTTWEERVTQLEEQGLTRSDAQGAVDVEILEGWRPSDFQPWMLLKGSQP
ncbi:MAG: hypothetical protein EBR82_44895 [Caulobacteraceae bacterium]|nr:hypothetical protein [Caulobacteraceae bacterium]